MAVKKADKKKRVVKKRVGHGLINKPIDLPLELHLPNYQYCGPGIQLDVRLARGDPGIFILDACKEHDIAYRASKRENKPELRRVADKVLLSKARQRVSSPNATVAEKRAALVVAGAMKVKLLLGGGIRRRERRM